MIVARTLTLYVARRFLAATAGMLLALTLLVSMFDFIELLRRAATRPDAGFALVASIAGLRMPFLSIQIMPFAILLGGILAFWRLTRSSELIVARATGLSRLRSNPDSSMVPATRRWLPRRLMAIFLPSSMVDTMGAPSGLSSGKVAL